MNRYSKKVIGIQNNGNICYLNSVLQLLCNIPELIDKNYNNDKIYSNFLSVHHEMLDDSSEITDDENMLDINYFKKGLENIHDIYKDNGQHDVHEVLNIILHHIHIGNAKDISYNNKNDNKTIIGYPVQKIIIYAAKKWYETLNKEGESNVTKYLQGQIRSKITCKKCWKEKNNFEIFRDLSLPVEENNDIYDCIKNFCTTEEINGENSVFCDKCKIKTSVVKKISLWKLPKYLIIHFKKFNFQMEKINKNITFPLKNLKIYTDTEKEKKYSLVGVIYHHGERCFYGHYTCCIKYSNKWFHINDENITEIDKNKICNKHAYLLLYKSL